MTVTCWDCGGDGHIAAACPYSGDVWCGICDELTRQIALTEDLTLMRRCPRCHPLRGRLLPQHYRCPACRAVIYARQAGFPCGKHTVVPDWQDAYHSGQVAVTMTGRPGTSEPDSARSPSSPPRRVMIT